MSSFWKGATHLELGVATDTPLQVRACRHPLGPKIQDSSLQLSSSSSGLELGEAAIGRRNARLQERGSEYWRLRGTVWEGVHQMPRNTLCSSQSHLVLVSWSRIHSKRRTKVDFHDGAAKEHSDDWKEPPDIPNETWCWVGVTTCTVGPDQSTIPNDDNATQDSRLKEGHAWIRAHVQPRYELFLRGKSPALKFSQQSNC